MSTLVELRRDVAQAENERQQLEAQAETATGKALDSLSGLIAAVGVKLALLRSRLATAEAQAAAEKQAHEARQKAQAQLAAQKAIQAQVTSLSARWARLGERFTAIDAELPALWAEYRALAQAALDLATAARAAGIEQPPFPDTGPADAVLRRICGGVSGIKDQRR